MRLILSQIKACAREAALQNRMSFLEHPMLGKRLNWSHSLATNNQWLPCKDVHG
jgi:hypothetical protein